MADKTFGGQKSDANREVIRAASGLKTQDNTTVPQDSPLTYEDAVITIEIPRDAVEVVFKPSTDMRVSELEAMTRYYVIAAGAAEVVGVADMSQIFIIRDVNNGVLNFRFNTV